MDLSMRPRFSTTTTRYATIIDALEGLTEAFEAVEETPCRVECFYEQQLEVRVAASHRHIWSPQLKLWVTQHEDHVHLRGIFGPEANVWTMFMAGYAVGGMTSLVGVMVLFSQMSLKGGERWGVGVLVVGLVVMAMVYGLSQAGRYFAREEMKLMYRTTRQSVLGEQVHLSR